MMAATAGEISGSSTKPVSVIVSAVSGASRAIREPWAAVEPAVNRNCERFIPRSLSAPILWRKAAKIDAMRPSG